MSSVPCSKSIRSSVDILPCKVDDQPWRLVRIIRNKIARGHPMLQDLRYALRQLLKNPGFSIVAILTLALAIGANTAIFSAIDAVLLHPLPYPEPGQLVFVGEDLKHFNLAKIPASPPEVNDYRNMATSFSVIGAVDNHASFTLTGTNNPEIVPGLSITASMFTMLGVKPIVGGLFTAEAEQSGKDHVAVISE